MNRFPRLTKVGRGMVLIVAGILAGSVLLQPALAHFQASLSHLNQHNDKRYVRLLRAERDGAGTVNVAGDTLTSDVSITAPRSGILVIHGSVFFNNGDGTDEDQVGLSYRVDAGPVTFGGRAIIGPEVVGGGNDPTEWVQVAYTDVVEVGAGPHTVNQFVTAAGTGIALGYDLENLVVEFWPATGAQLEPAA